jgi:GNAT superfamily N-acetyltransferase
MAFDIVVEQLGKIHQRQNFDCGEESLNLFLKNYARQNDEKGLGKTYVAVQPGENEILGYYTLSSGSVSFENVPEKLPRYPTPTAHLGRLAVDVRQKGKGLGEFLLIDALARVARVSDQLGIYAVEVYALNESAKRFYLKYGFTELIDDEKHLYTTLKTVRQLHLK